jgi:hypothetical protein
MPMIDEPPWPFLMTPAQHGQWVKNAQRVGRHDWRFITSSPPA